MKFRKIIFIVLFAGAFHYGFAQKVNYFDDLLTGVYSTLRYQKEVGDLVGVEVSLLNSQQGLYVIFQSAEGGAASVPVVVKASLVGNRIEFSLPDDAPYPGRFVGTISKSKIIGRFDAGYLSPTQPGDVFVIPKGKSYWQR